MFFFSATHISFCEPASGGLGSGYGRCLEVVLVVWEVIRRFGRNEDVFLKVG